LVACSSSKKVCVRVAGCRTKESIRCSQPSQTTSSPLPKLQGGKSEVQRRGAGRRLRGRGRRAAGQERTHRLCQRPPRWAALCLKQANIQPFILLPTHHHHHHHHMQRHSLLYCRHAHALHVYARHPWPHHPEAYRHAVPRARPGGAAQDAPWLRQLAVACGADGSARVRQVVERVRELGGPEIEVEPVDECD
jgi:hypothetical protein